MKRSTKTISIILVFFLIIAIVIIGRTMIGNHFKKKFSKRPPPGIIITEVVAKEFSEKIETFGTAISKKSESFKIKKEDMDYVVDLNIKAAFHVAQMGAKIMIQSKNRKSIGGSIINMSSQLGKVGAPIRSIYNMTKCGIEGLTKGMAIDLAKYNIRVNIIAPTFVVTPMTKKFFKNKNFRKEVLGNIPLGRYAELPEISSAAVFLASDAASMITGTSLLVDGGWTAR